MYTVYPGNFKKITKYSVIIVLQLHTYNFLGYLKLMGKNQVFTIFNENQIL